MSTQPTQSRYPWRATVRTVAAAVVGLALILPGIVDVLGIGAVPWVAGLLAAIGTATRVLAMPSVNEWLRRYVLTGWLAAEPRKPEEY